MAMIRQVYGEISVVVDYFLCRIGVPYSMSHAIDGGDSRYLIVLQLFAMLHSERRQFVAVDVEEAYGMFCVRDISSDHVVVRQECAYIVCHIGWS